MRYLETAPDRPRLEGERTFTTFGFILMGIVDISAATSMTLEDVHATLVQQGMISTRDSTPPVIKPSPGQSIKIPKGRKNGIARRHLQRVLTQEKEDTACKGPFEPPINYEIHWDQEAVSEYLRNWAAKGYLTLKPEKLKWSPYLIARTRKTEAMEAMATTALVAAEQTSLTQSPDSIELNGCSLGDADRETDTDPSRKQSESSPNGRMISEGGETLPAIETPLRRRGRPPATPSSIPPDLSNGRVLRSRPNDLATTPTPSKRIVSSRKRRRVESSPDETPPPSTVSDPLICSPVNGQTRAQHPILQRAPTFSDLMKGSHVQLKTMVVQPVVPEFEGEPDLKAEDFGTPFSGLKSDDTVVAADEPLVIPEPEHIEEDTDADGDYDIEMEDCTESV